MLQPLPIPDMAWSHISLDFVEGLPKSHRKDVIMVVVDRLTRYSHFIALSHPYNAQSIAHLFIDNIVKLHGFLNVIVSDRDAIFTSDLWKALFNAMKVQLNFSSAHHPQTDGQTERVNQCLENYLRCMSFSEPQKWSSWLALAEWWYNTSYHASLKCTSFQAMYGYFPPLICEVMVPGPEYPATEFLSAKQSMLANLKENLATAQARIKKYSDLKRRERSFVVRDLVYLRLQPYREAALAVLGNLKLATKYYGPFRVVQKIGAAAYKVDLPEATKIHHVFHVSQLKKHLGKKVVPCSTLPMVTPDGYVKTEPEQLLSTRSVPAGNTVKPQWRSKWANLTEADSSWEDCTFIQSTFPTFYYKILKGWFPANYP
jgi:hypothetical protein